MKNECVARRATEFEKTGQTVRRCPSTVCLAFVLYGRAVETGGFPVNHAWWRTPANKGTAYTNQKTLPYSKRARRA